MNILFLTSSLQRFPHDSQVPFVLEQALAWKKAQPNDEIFILAPHDIHAKQIEELNGLHINRFIYWWPKRWQKLVYPAILPNILNNPFLVFQFPFFLFSEFFVTLKLVKRFKIDLIFAHWVMPQGLIAYLIHKCTKVTYGLKNYSSDLRIFLKIPLLGKWLARRIIKNSKVLFCENSNLKKEASFFFNGPSQALINDKIIALTMGVSHLSLKTNVIPKHDFGFIGRLSKKKGIEYFFAALRELEKQGVNIKSSIAGEGEEKENLLELSKNLKVEFMGFVEDDKKAEFFSESKCLVFPSVETKSDVEGLPVALLEAIYFGKLVIASRDTNIELIPEWPQIQDVVFLLHDPRDINKFSNLLRKILDLNDEEAQLRTNRVKELFLRYNWDNLIYEYMTPLKKNHV